MAMAGRARPPCNFFRLHSSLDGRAPAEAVGIPAEGRNGRAALPRNAHARKAAAQRRLTPGGGGSARAAGTAACGPLLPGPRGGTAAPRGPRRRMQGGSAGGPGAPPAPGGAQ